MLKNSTQRYGAVARALHWGMALLILALIGVGLYMAGLPEEAPNRLQLYTMHKAFGSLLMLLAVLRIVWLFVSPPPPPPPALRKVEIVIAKSVMGLLYLLMLAIPFSGYAMSTLAGYPVSFFGLFDLPALFAKAPDAAKTAGTAHELLAYLLIVLVVLHVLGAVKHRLKGNADADVLKRML